MMKFYAHLMWMLTKLGIIKQLLDNMTIKGVYL